MSLSRERGVRLIFSVATLGMLLLSWPLWVDSRDFPRIPFFDGWPTLSPAWSGAGLGLTAITIALSPFSRLASGVSVLLLAGLVLGDQNRFQPWVYQFALAALSFATLPTDQALGPCRWVMIAMHGHSALAKCDLSFCQELGPALLNPALRCLGNSFESWPTPWKHALILTMPLAELAIAAALAWRPTRRWGLVGLTVMHASLIALCGPWGLNQSFILLVWNAALIIEAWLLFRSSDLPSPARWGLAPAVTVLALLFPFTERWGLCDPWPAFALYASHVGRAEVAIPSRSGGTLPTTSQAYLKREGPWTTLDLTAWSRAVRGVPIYPGGRVALGVARALAQTCPGLRVILWGPADRYSGQRTRQVAIGRDEIRALSTHFRLNSRPAPVRPTSGTPNASRGGGSFDR